MALFFCQAEGKTQQASASRTVLLLLGNQGRFYMWGSQSRVYDKDQSSESLAFFLSFALFQNSHSWRQATR